MENSLIDSIISSLYRNLLAGEAYILILRGLYTTIKISFFGLFLGSLWGALLCYFRLSKTKTLNLFSDGVGSLLRGSPVLLLLMMLYYVIFADYRIDAVIIAIIAFALNSGAHIAEIIRSSIQATNKKEIEAARMLGFTKYQALVYITTPQAWRVAKPLYKNAIINLIQWTSVVGYVTITDLTRSLNNIGNRTGDSFFVLFFGIFIYLGLSVLVELIFDFRKKKGSKR